MQQPKPYAIRSGSYTPLATPDYLIGIDPDTDRHGVAIRHKSILSVTLMDLFELVSYLEGLDGEVSIYVSAGWLNKTSAFNDARITDAISRGLHRKGLRGQTLATATARAAKWALRKASADVGANHEAGRQLIRFCRSLGYTVAEVKPTTTKMSNALFKMATGIELPETVAQDMIDAFALIA